MIGKIIFLVFLIVLLGVASWFLYQNLPGDPEQFIMEEINNPDNLNNLPEIQYSETPMFYSNIRFNHNQISYNIESSCSQERVLKMEDAFFILHNKTKIISFYPVGSENADISIGCSENYLSQEENLFVAGEGGPSEIVNTSLYTVILKGKMMLYKESLCRAPIVELHELLHVFGFDHSNNPKNIMYNFSSCNQEITKDITDNLISLYSIEPLPDLSIEEVNATKRGRYFDFKIKIINQGLEDITNSSFIVSSDEEDIYITSLGEMAFGEGKILEAKNLKLPSRNTEKVRFIVDGENEIRELREDNNAIELSVGS